MRSLVVHTGGIGDFLLACPAMARLAVDGPVMAAGNPERLALAVEARLVVKAVSLDAIDFTSVFSTPSQRFRSVLEEVERAVVWMRDEDGRIAGALRACGLHEVVVRPGLPPEGWPRHASTYYLESLGFPDDGSTFHLSVPPADSPLDVVIHPGSGGKSKNWPLECFIAVARGLAAQGRSVSWVEGPAEEELRLPSAMTRLPRKSLVELSRCLAATRLFIGNDSGISHLAAAVGCPTVVVFGPTDPRVWAPRGMRVTVAKGDPWPSVDQVLNAAGLLGFPPPA